MSYFDLHSLVKEVCDSSPLTNDADLTKEILSKIDKADEHAALEQALLVYVRRFVSRDHRPLAAPQFITPKSSTADQVHDDTHLEVVGGGAVPFRSRKVKSIRTAWQIWQDQLKARVNVAYGERKFFGDCTLDDLAYMAKQRREHAARNIAAAEYTERIAALMVQFGVKSVRDLPESAVQQLGDVA